MNPKKRKITIILLVVFFLMLLTPVIPFVFHFVYELGGVISTEIQIRRYSLYKPCAKDLAHFVSNINNWSEHDYIGGNDIGYIWQPDSFEKLPGKRFAITPNQATIWFGGGFYPLGYTLVLNKEKTSETEVVWDMYIKHERRGTKLYSYQLSKENQEYFNKLYTEAISRYDNLIQAEPDNKMYLEQKNNFIKLFANTNSPDQ